MEYKWRKKQFWSLILAASTISWLLASVKKERMARITEVAKRAEIAYVSRFLGTERTVLFEEDGGYSENYIRIYAHGAREGMLARVKLVKLYRDGAFAEITEEIK